MYHDMAMFVRLGERKGNYSFIHFNPNEYSKSSIVTEMYKKFPKSMFHGYHDEDNNVLEICTYLSWQQILNVFFYEGRNPFFDGREIYIYDHRDQKYCKPID